ncbi:unnamed protein product, partial [Rotaria magnacalcarata]
HRTNKIS